MEVIWKDCPGFRNKYQASNTGLIRSLNYKKTGERVILKQRPIYSGYLVVSMDNKNRFVSRVIAQTFLPNPNNLPEVDHQDQDKTNNHISNLRWVNKSQNAINRKTPGSNTGQRNIYRGKFGFKLIIERKDFRFSQYFPTLEEAIRARDEYIQTKENVCAN